MEFFPADSKYRQRPKEVIDDTQWQNHLEVLFMVICEVKMFFVDSTFSELITSDDERSEEKLAMDAKLTKKIMDDLDSAKFDQLAKNSSNIDSNKWVAK